MEWAVANTVNGTLCACAKQQLQIRVTKAPPYCGTLQAETVSVRQLSEENGAAYLKPAKAVVALLWEWMHWHVVYINIWSWYAKTNCMGLWGLQQVCVQRLGCAWLRLHFMPSLRVCHDCQRRQR